MRTTLLSTTAGVLIAFGAAPALATDSPPETRALTALPQVVAPTDAPTPPPVVDEAPVFVPDEEVATEFAYPAVFLVPIALLVGAAWAARAFTRDLTPTSF